MKKKSQSKGQEIDDFFFDKLDKILDEELKRIDKKET